MSESLLEGIQKLTTGQQAALRREAGKRMSEADATSLQAFYSAMPPDTPVYCQERMYAVMCIMCLWKPEERKNPQHFARCLKLINNSESSDGRLRTLLDTDYQEDDGFLIGKLARLAKQIHSSEKRLFPDCEQLYSDLLKCNSSYRGVQRRWMELYIRDDKNENDTSENNGGNQ